MKSSVNGGNQSVNIQGGMTKEESLYTLITQQLIAVSNNISRTVIFILFTLFFVASNIGTSVWMYYKMSTLVEDQIAITKQHQKHIWELKSALKLKFSQER
jgi:hypothetical protein